MPLSLSQPFFSSFFRLFNLKYFVLFLFSDFDLGWSYTWMCLTVEHKISNIPALGWARPQFSKWPVNIIDDLESNFAGYRRYCEPPPGLLLVHFDPNLASHWLNISTTDHTGNLPGHHRVRCWLVLFANLYVQELFPILSIIQFLGVIGNIKLRR